jgi:hypothetical protein
VYDQHKVCSDLGDSEDGFDKELLPLGVSGGDNGRSIIEHVMDFGFASRVRGSRNAGTRGIRLVVSDLLDALAFG